MADILAVRDEYRAQSRAMLLQECKASGMTNRIFVSSEEYLKKASFIGKRSHKASWPGWWPRSWSHYYHLRGRRNNCRSGFAVQSSRTEWIWRLLPICCALSSAYDRPVENALLAPGENRHFGPCGNCLALTHCGQYPELFDNAKVIHVPPHP